MEKIILKNFIGALIFFGTGIGLVYLVNARSGTTATPGDKLTSAKWNELVANSSIPSGQVAAFYLASCPTGRKPADGTNSTPDLRGEFIRGLDNGRAVDTGRTLGSFQRGSLVMNDALSTDYRLFNLIHQSDDRLGYDKSVIDTSKTYSFSKYDGASSSILTWAAGFVDVNYVGMTRPRNVALLYCVKN